MGSSGAPSQMKGAWKLTLHLNKYKANQNGKINSFNIYQRERQIGRYRESQLIRPETSTDQGRKPKL